MNIFIVHSRADKKRVYEIRDEINKLENVKIFYLEHEKIWHHKARKLIKDSQMVLYLIGNDSIKKRNVNWELRRAKKYKKQILCCFLDDKNIISAFNEKKRNLNKPLYRKKRFQKGYDFLAKVKNIEEVKKEISDYENNEYVDLINSVFDDDNEKLFEQYKLFAKTSEDLLTRRQNVNSFYMSANAALITIIATVFSVVEGNWISKLIITIAISIPGIFMCSSWSQILESYGTINSSKMVILGIMEKKLPASLFQAEWQVMDCKYNKKPYVSFTKGESRTPKWFRGLYIAIIVICLLGIFPLLLHKVYKENILGLQEPISVLYEKLLGFIREYLKNL